MTDLGPQGNEVVRKRLAEYLQKPSQCTLKGKGKRVLISGFGPFGIQGGLGEEGHPNPSYNISGLVVEALSNRRVWPDSIWLEEIATAQSDEVLRVAHQPFGLEQQGGAVVQRSIEIDGEPFELCLLSLEVQWDLAAAILLTETARFQPDMILMTGLASNQALLATIEAAAVNDAKLSPGYLAGGAVDLKNQPVQAGESSYLLSPKLAGVVPEVAMRWDGARLMHRANPHVHSPFQVQVATGARCGNNYVCNNVSYMMLLALNGVDVELAGGRIQTAPNIAKPYVSLDKIILPMPKTVAEKVAEAGFFHFPAHADDTLQSVFGWAKVLAAMVATNQ